LQPGAAIDRRRFRPNLNVETGAEWTGFVEDAWLGGTLAVGATLRIDGMQPALGCVTTTLAQGDLLRDLGLLRTSAKHHRGCLGVFGAVRVPAWHAPATPSSCGSDSRAPVQAYFLPSPSPGDVASEIP